MMEKDGIVRLYLKFDNTGRTKTAHLHKGHLLGTITPWQPPTPRRHQRIAPDAADRAFLDETRRDAALLMYSTDEDTATGWHDSTDSGNASSDTPPSMQQRDESTMWMLEDTSQQAMEEDQVPQDIAIPPRVTNEHNSDPTPTATTTNEAVNTELGSDEQNSGTQSDTTSTARSTHTTMDESAATDESPGIRVWEERRIDTVELNILSSEQQISLKRQTTHIRPPNPTKKHRPVLLNVVKVHQSRLERRPSQVATTEMLPHILFPVGNRQPGQSWKTMPTIRALLDTGSGLNIGYGPYWRSVAEQCPTLVREYGKLDDTDCDRLTVGGIDKNGEGTACSHYIVLKTPFIEQGKEVDLRIALTDGLSCNLIFGLPFIVRARMTINMWEKYVVSTVFHTTFPLHYHPPELRDSIVPQDGTPLTLTAARKLA